MRLPSTLTTNTNRVEDALWRPDSALIAPRRWLRRAMPASRVTRMMKLLANYVSREVFPTSRAIVRWSPTRCARYPARAEGTNGTRPAISMHRLTVAVTTRRDCRRPKATAAALKLLRCRPPRVAKVAAGPRNAHRRSALQAQVVFASKVSNKTSAAGAEDAGFCPVISKPAVTTWGPNRHLCCKGHLSFSARLRHGRARSSSGPPPLLSVCEASDVLALHKRRAVRRFCVA